MKWRRNWFESQSSGEKWSQRRKMITPTFHFDILKDFFAVMNEHAVTLIDNLKNKKSKDNFVLEEHLRAYTLDVICGL